MLTKLRQKLSIIYFAFFASSWVYLLIGAILHHLPWQPVLTGSNLPNLLAGVFFLVSLTIPVFLNILMARIDQSSLQFAEGVGEQTIVSTSIILLALSELPAILALVLFLLTAQWMAPLGLWLISLICFLFVRPACILPSHD